MNILKKVSFSALLSLFLIFCIAQNTTFAASIGDQLDEPETGWTRYEYSDKNITYGGGTWFRDTTGPLTWNSPYLVLNTSMKFNFTGTKLRLISTTWWSGSDSIDVIIDGKKVDNISLKGTSNTNHRMMYEKTGLSNGTHSVEFVNIATTGDYLFLYAIDTDGPLSPFSPIDSNPTPTEPNPGNPDPTQPKGERAILTVTMTTGLEKEYDLPMSDVNAFLNWYDARDAGSGPAKFTINKYSNNKGPYTKRTEYVIFDKILTFEVSEYTTN